MIIDQSSLYTMVVCSLVLRSLTELLLSLEEVSDELCVGKDELENGLHVTVVQLIDDGSTQVLRATTRYLT